MRRAVAAGRRHERASACPSRPAHTNARGSGKRHGGAPVSVLTRICMAEARASDLRGGAWATRWGRRERGWRGARWAHARPRERTVLGNLRCCGSPTQRRSGYVRCLPPPPGVWFAMTSPRLPRKSSHSEVYARSRTRPFSPAPPPPSHSAVVHIGPHKTKTQDQVESPHPAPSYHVTSFTVSSRRSTNQGFNK